MWVKICGNTNLEDAQYAAASGADAVGFIFAASKRQVTPGQVAVITQHLPANVERIGVFDTPDADTIVQSAHEAGLTAVQLHGGLNAELIEELAQRLNGVEIIQALHWNVSDEEDEAQVKRIARELDRLTATGTVRRVLIDTKAGVARGGTGVAYDWQAAREVFASAPAGLSLIVAGGLKAANVADAIAALKPVGVDVSSGVEASPGKKDPALVAAFIRRARGF